jgi:GNAT superfamily N-acetyltransferase
VILREAVAADVPALMALLADDGLSAGRGDTNRPEDRGAYDRAFAAIDADPNHLLIVLEESERVIGTMQLTLLPGLSRVGASRLQIEGVRVAGADRSRGLGTAMLRWALEHAPAFGADLVQLTSDAGRPDAHRFYERLGFVPSHVGFKHAVTRKA